MAAVLLEAWQDWECPNCGVTDRTRALPRDAVRFHPCPALHMLVAPLVPAGTDCKVVACAREDYLGREEQRTGDDGKPYSAVRTVHADGHTDAAVFPGVAVARLGASDMPALPELRAAAAAAAGAGGGTGQVKEG